MRKAISFAFILILAGCSTVPITGRKQLSFIPQGQLLSLSDESYKDVLSKSTLSTDAAKTSEVMEVGRNIASAAESFMRDNGMEKELANYNWEFNVIQDDKIVNAFCMPGGKIVVYTGILPVTQDKNGLATVISHEVAHAIANHGGERMSQELVVQAGGMGISQLMKSRPEQARQIMQQVYGAGAQYGVLLPYSRSHENEADHIGLILMARAGYDPKAAVAFWERMNKLGGAKVPEILSTHPATSRRIANIEKEIPEAEKYYKS
ncbi:MAG TPA: M48 family metallopeptidase [Candidatus Omnitrophota bacterium]|jgi:predicted Zn-dependent protease|nr:MAG: TPR repeat-containing protein YfgC precursor [Candidatus Omnitrophica bacterium ADurb.Bin314]HOE69172.1 M48 family metallopeptidase [Candidatus Omnitrophota bacterium]HQB94646.1 M48 family metallopeptidase [Candidatus Omnitrophota bacterium]